ncbi:MAG: NADH-quinone oxidoreductase subunit NuoH [Chloroflexi bacterium]|nr:NADH-quinone oxidoreductase subunit NuoH [Chloroflexota bacterium]
MVDGWDVLILVIKALAIFIIVPLAPLVFVLAERKILGRIQSRIGPNRVGPWGLLQTLADGIKLGAKEDFIPPAGDRVVFWLAPLFMVVPAAMAWAVIPIGPEVEIGRKIGLWVTDLNVAILYILALGSVAVYGPVMAGWSSNSKYALFGSLRSTAQVISYEITMGVAVLGVLVYTGSFSLVDIVEKQKDMWFAVPQILGLFVFFVSGIAETNRAPFDLPEAETEIVAGYHVEYSGMRFAMFFLAEYANMFLVSALAVILFFGGWHGWTIPGIEGLTSVLWFMLKTLALMFVYFWLRATLPRLRYDQLMAFCWKFLLPLGIVNLLITAVLRLGWS